MSLKTAANGPVYTELGRTILGDMQDRSSELNERIRRQAGRVPQPQEARPEKKPAPDLGSGARAPVVRADPNRAMSAWMRERHHQLATRGEHVTIPRRRTP